MLLAGGTLEALQMVNLVPHTHRHLERSDPLLAGSTQTVLTEEPARTRKILTWKNFTEPLIRQDHRIRLGGTLGLLGQLPTLSGW